MHTRVAQHDVLGLACAQLDVGTRAGGIGERVAARELGLSQRWGRL